MDCESSKLEWKLVGNARKLRKNLTDAEKLLWKQIRCKKLGYKFHRQFIFDDKYILDFYCSDKKLVIELDGGQHNESSSDEERDAYLKARGCKILRFWNNEFMSNIDDCLYVIMESLSNI